MLKWLVCFGVLIGTEDDLEHQNFGRGVGAAELNVVMV